MPEENEVGGITDESAAKERSFAIAKIDERLQLRVHIDSDAVEQYADLLRNKKDRRLPPVTIALTENDKWYLVDGDHRVRAAQKIGQATIPAVVVRVKNRDEALLLAAGANDAFGIRRTAADLRNIIKTLLERWPKRSDTWLAKTIKCSPTTVGRVRKSLSTVDSDGEREDANGRRMNVGKIGRRKSSRVVEEPVEPSADSPVVESEVEENRSDTCPHCGASEWVVDDDGRFCAKCHEPGGAKDQSPEDDQSPRNNQADGDSLSPLAEEESRLRLQRFQRLVTEASKALHEAEDLVPKMSDGDARTARLFAVRMGLAPLLFSEK